MKHILTGKRKKPKPTLPEDTVELLKKKNIKLERLIEVFELEIN